MWSRFEGAAPHSVPGQHDEHEPADPVIAHVHMLTPLYVHVQVDPMQAASQRSPALSLHVARHVATPFGPPVPPPEHEASPVGRGMFGHTLAGTLPPGAMVGFVTVVTEPFSFRQLISACCCESQPPTYCAIPMLEQVG
jgi:hypothetical protein